MRDAARLGPVCARQNHEDCSKGMAPLCQTPRVFMLTVVQYRATVAIIAPNTRWERELLQGPAPVSRGAQNVERSPAELDVLCLPPTGAQEAHHSMCQDCMSLPSDTSGPHPCHVDDYVSQLFKGPVFVVRALREISLLLELDGYKLGPFPPSLSPPIPFRRPSPLPRVWQPSSSASSRTPERKI